MEKFLIEVLAGLVLLLLGGLFQHINSKISRVLQKLELVIIEQQSTDYALEKSFGNGYKKYKEAKQKELMEDSKFINKLK